MRERTEWTTTSAEVIHSLLVLFRYFVYLPTGSGWSPYSEVLNTVYFDVLMLRLYARGLLRYAGRSEMFNMTGRQPANPRIHHEFVNGIAGGRWIVIRQLHTPPLPPQRTMQVPLM